MEKIRSKVKRSFFPSEETRQHLLFKFLAVFAIFSFYLIFMVHRYGLEHGIAVSILTWSFFVLSTPIADAGFLVDFPLRLVTGIKMLYSETLVWVFALSFNLYALSFHPEWYQSTTLLSFFEKLLTHPFPYWGIILLSLAGTFLSVYFGDELFEVVAHRERSFYHKHKYNYHTILVLFSFVLVFSLYSFFISHLGIREVFISS